MKRRQMLKILGATPAAATLVWTADASGSSVETAATTAPQAAGTRPAYKPRFFNAHEFATIAALADMIIPKDDRSGSATDSGAHEFIDYIVAEQPDRQVPMRGGLVWLDTECRSRFDKDFVTCTDPQRRQVLDDIAYPKRAKPGMSHGVRFFTSLRDLVATGFWSSKMGVEDLGYMGNRPATWDGPPAEVLKKLGL